MDEYFIKLGVADWQMWGFMVVIYLLIMFLLQVKFNELTWFIVGIYLGGGACRFITHYFEWSLNKIKENQRKNKWRKLNATRV